MRGAKPAEEAFEALRAQLGGELPEGLRKLNREQLVHLDAAVREARHRQAQALAAAGDRALRHVPRLLRGPIRRITG
jgi:hypothetical protein